MKSMSSYAFWTAPLALFAITIPLSVVTSVIGIPGVPGLPELIVILFTLGGLLAIPLGFWALFGYYWDAKILNQTQADWSVTWPLWAIGHLIFSPLLTAPIYLLFRTLNTGYPWNHGYTLR